MRVTLDAAEQCAAIDACPSENMFDLIAAANGDPAVFFEGGLWEGIDFSSYDMSGVGFRGACVIGCIFREGDLSEKTIATCRVFSGNRVVPSSKAGPQEVRIDSVEVLISLVAAYNPQCDTDLIRRAYTYSEKMHDGQLRHSGMPYFGHPLAVSAILTGMRADDETIVTALLHDCIEDTRATFSEIRTKFGNEIAELVDEVTKLTNLQLSTSETAKAQDFRKLSKVMSSDPRPTLVKLADRLHNIWTMDHMRPEKAAQKAREALGYFAPLACGTGLHWICQELRECSFQVLAPETRETIRSRLSVLDEDNADATIRTEVGRALAAANVKAEVIVATKNPYSIWRQFENKDLGSISPIEFYYCWIIVRNEEECYSSLDAIHRLLKEVPGKLRDYINQPKPNGYQSIHTAVSINESASTDVQICSREMYKRGELNSAKLFFANEGSPGWSKVDMVDWLSQVAETKEEFFDEHVVPVFPDQVYCFSPSDVVVKLPRGATPLDFAFTLGTSIGESCVGAKVANLRVPLWTRLRNGQRVEIITAEGQSPQATWLDIVVTDTAKARIRERLNEENRERFIRLGRELARAAFGHIEEELTDRALEIAAKHFGLVSIADLLERLGSAEIVAKDVVLAVYPNQSERKSQ